MEIPGIGTIRRGAASEDILIRGYRRDNINVLMEDQSVFGAFPNRTEPPAFHIDLSETEFFRKRTGGRLCFTY